MGKDQREQKNEYDLDRLIQCSYGLSDDQILERMRMAEGTVDDSGIPPKQERGYQYLVEQVEARNLRPHFREEYEKEKEKEGERRVRCLGPMIRVVMAAAILWSVLVMTSIPVGARKDYRYDQSIRENQKGDVALNNDINKEKEDELDLAYEEIHDQIGINVMRLEYRPQGMWYLKTIQSSRQVVMHFSYNNHTIYVIQQLKTESNSANVISSRKKVVKSVYNDWLRKDIVIESAATNKNEEEYSARILQDNAYYYICGVIELDEFELILQNLTFME